MKRTVVTIGNVFLIMVFAGLCYGTTYTVNDDGPADFSNIQAAISSATTGDLIVVSQGHYYENINFFGKNITLTSSDPYSPSIVSNTIIDGGGIGSTVTFNGAETPDCTLTVCCFRRNWTFPEI